MNKIIKRIAAVCLCIIIGTTSVLCVSADTPKFDTGVISDNGSEYESYINSLSDDDVERMNDKLSRVQSIEKQIIQDNVNFKINGTKSSPYKIDIPGTFTIYYQSTSYYCVPASVKSVLQYINGSSSSQSTIARALDTTTSGTSMSKVPEYLNKKQDDCIYLLKNYPSQSSMCAAIYSTITNDKDPCIMGITDKTGNYWGYYATDGHALVVNAIYSDKSKIQFADPLGAEDNIPSFYTKYASNVSHVCNSIIY